LHRAPNPIRRKLRVGDRRWFRRASPDYDQAMRVKELTPMLTVSDATSAARFYEQAFGASERRRLETPTGQLVVEMSLEGHAFYVVGENPDAFNLSPSTLGGTSVRISLVVDDPDAVAASAVAAGGTEVFPVDDQPYGMRQGRIADPAGHHWLIGKPLERS
jgi:PhnB protein